MRNQRLEISGRMHTQPWSFAILGVGLALVMLLGVGCRPDGVAGSERYPDYVSKIMRRECANAGCHTAKSAEAAAGLNLESWDDLFKGSRGGSPVVPYSPDQSYLLYAVNTDPSLGPTLAPTMPIGRPALSSQQYADLRKWITEGARNDRGKERFPPDPARRKWYVGNSGCDLIAVIDAESRQIMRYIPVGSDDAWIEEIHSIVLTPDQSSIYVLFDAFSPHVEQYSTLTDEKLGEMPLVHNGWNAMAITADSKYAFVVGEVTRLVATFDLQQGQIVSGPITLSNNLHSPTLHPLQSTLYLAMKERSGLFALDYNASGVVINTRTIDLLQGRPSLTSGELMPYQIQFLPDGSKYFVACTNSHEVRVLDGDTDSLLEVITVGRAPSGLAYAPASNRLFVACPEDQSLFPTDQSKRGSIMVIDAQSHQVLKTLYTGFEPFGVSIDEGTGLAVVTNRNQSINGPSPHHASAKCVGRNGYVTLIDLATLELVPDFKMEVTVDPQVVTVKR